jgi:hypothetical protein
MKSKIIFVTDPDMITGPSIAIKNFNDSHIKDFLNLCENTLAIYLIDKNSSNQWLNNIKKQNIIVFDCLQLSVKKILEHAK